MGGREHHYEITVSWTGDLGSGTSGYRDYSRDHDVRTEGPPVLAGSSDPSFRGDPARWNPEQLLVAALSQCHMLWYLHLCSTSGVVVREYVDEAHGVMLDEGNAGGHFSEVVLRPRIAVASPEMVDKAQELHEAAHKLCFIANSVNFPVRHEPVVTAR